MDFFTNSFTFKVSNDELIHKRDFFSSLSALSTDLFIKTKLGRILERQKKVIILELTKLKLTKKNFMH